MVDEVCSIPHLPLPQTVLSLVLPSTRLANVILRIDRVLDAGVHPKIGQESTSIYKLNKQWVFDLTHDKDGKVWIVPPVHRFLSSVECHLLEFNG